MTENNASFGKPEGIAGEKLLDQMDEGHTPVSLWALTNFNINEEDIILDIGCGSGLNIKRLHEKSPNSKSWGIDHSTTSVKKAIKLNKNLVDTGKIEVLEANVIDLPFDSKFFDIITGFETVYFWPTIVDSFREVKRVLKDDGLFVLVLEANGMYSEELKQIAADEGCTFYNDDELKEYLIEAGFSKITINIRKRNDNKKIIKRIFSGDYYEKITEDLFDGDSLFNSDTDSPEWLCIVAEK